MFVLLGSPRVSVPILVSGTHNAAEQGKNANIGETRPCAAPSAFANLASIRRRLVSVLRRRKHPAEHPIERGAQNVYRIGRG
jgi:hypothetical protein